MVNEYDDNDAVEAIESSASHQTCLIETKRDGKKLNNS